MSESKADRVQSIFSEALQQPVEEREAFVLQRCGDDDEVREQILDLLTALDDAGAFMSEPTSDSKGLDAVGVATIQSVPREQSGEQIGRYKLLQQIGEGGFGTVWMADQKEPVKRRVALKIIKLGMDTKQVIARFEAERQALAMMDHPNIAKVLDAGATESGRPFFVMEYIRGVPILEYCDTEKLDTRARLDLFTLVCQAIQHAHQKGIIHRDIKPNNVMITLHDGVPVPKVIDFGIAKATNQELTEKTLFTQHRQMIGTPAYMSPEQAEMSGLDIDTRSDIYSLGVLLYEMLTGTTPFTHEELMQSGFEEMMRIIRESEPHKPSTRMSTLGETASRTAEQRHVADPKKLGVILRGDLDWIVMKCLEKDRSRRYDTANGLAADILRHLDNEPVLASPPSASYKFRKFVRRNRGQVVAAGVVAAAMLVGIAGITGGMVWAMNEKNRATEAETATQLELTRTAEVKRLITEMLSGIDPAKAQGADITLLKGILDETSDRLVSGEVEDELIAAELHSVVGEVYTRLGLYPEAERHVPAAAEIRSRVLGDEHPSTLVSLANVSSLHYVQGRYAEAEALAVEVHKTQRRVLGDEHQDTLKSMNGMAVLHHIMGRYAEAEPLYIEVWKIRERVLGKEHLDTLESMENLAILYSNQDRYAEAEPLHVQGLEISKRVLGDEHPETLYRMDTLATLYENERRFAEAEPLTLETLEIRKRVLGEEHPDTVQSMHGLAVLYTNQGRFAEAEPLHLEAVEVRTRILGEEHPDTLFAIFNLATVYDFQGRYAEAEPLFLETLEVRTRMLGEEHPDTLSSMNSLASLYRRQGRYAEAEPLYLETLEIQKRVLGDEHANTLGSITNLGLLYNSLKRYEEAAAMFETSLPIKRRVLGMGHPWTRFAMRGLAESYTELGRTDEALPLWRELLELRLAAANEPDASATTLNGAAWTLLTHDVPELHDPNRALALATRACAIEESAGGRGLPYCLDTLALAQHKTGDTAAAVETQKRAISLMPEGMNEATWEEFTANLHTYEAALVTDAESAGSDEGQ